MPLEGRGAHYSRLRDATERALARVYRGGWSARAVHRAGLQARVRTCVHRVACDRWPSGVRPLRIAFASDLHAGPTTHPSLFDEAVHAIEASKPDVVLLGGDYVFMDAREIDVLASRLARLRATFARFAVMGNHDLWADDARIARALEGAGYRVLVNEAAHLPPPFDHVSICGLDEPWTGSPDARATFAGARDVRVLLVHAPSGLLLAKGERFDLAMCGHTHGGHIALPFGVPIVSPGPLSRRYPHGAHVLDGGATLIVSRGIGATEIALRLFADPDVRVVDLGPRQ
jgi:hypothetical protein